MPPSGDVAVVIPARNESDRIHATVTAAAGLPGVDVLVVVADGSHDGTAGLHPARPGHLLFLDADLAESASHAAPLAEPVRSGHADMTIAVFSSRVKQGGHGFVVALSGSGIRRATGWCPAQPLNGQRCLTRAAFEAARPLAPGFGVETALTIDLHRIGMRITEVEVPLTHRATGGDWRGPGPPAPPVSPVPPGPAGRAPGPPGAPGPHG